MSIENFFKGLAWLVGLVGGVIGLFLVFTNEDQRREILWVACPSCYSKQIYLRDLKIEQTDAFARDIEEAAVIARKIIDLDPKYHKSWRVLGISCFYKGNYSCAVDNFRKAYEFTTKIDKDFDLLNLAESYIHVFDGESALILLSNSSADFDIINYYKSKAYFYNNDFDKALPQIEILAGPAVEKNVSRGKRYILASAIYISMSNSSNINNTIKFRLIDRYSQYFWMGVEEDRKFWKDQICHGHLFIYESFKKEIDAIVNQIPMAVSRFCSS